MLHQTLLNFGPLKVSCNFMVYQMTFKLHEIWNTINLYLKNMFVKDFLFLRFFLYLFEYWLSKFLVVMGFPPSNSK
jgi:hypothetical protein